MSALSIETLNSYAAGEPLVLTAVTWAYGAALVLASPPVAGSSEPAAPPGALGVVPAPPLGPPDEPLAPAAARLPVPADISGGSRSSWSFPPEHAKASANDHNQRVSTG